MPVKIIEIHFSLQRIHVFQEQLQLAAEMTAQTKENVPEETPKRKRRLQRLQRAEKRNLKRTMTEVVDSDQSEQNKKQKNVKIELNKSSLKN